MEFHGQILRTVVQKREDRLTRSGSATGDEAYPSFFQRIGLSQQFVALCGVKNRGQLESGAGGHVTGDIAEQLTGQAIPPVPGGEAEADGPRQPSAGEIVVLEPTRGCAKQPHPLGAAEEQETGDLPARATEF